MKRTLTVLALISLSLALLACKKKEDPTPSVKDVCARGCESSARCDAEEDPETCEADCESDLEEASDSCLKALDEFLDCGEDSACEENDAEDGEPDCSSEGWGVFISCPELIDFDLDDTDSGACCGPEDTCNWANDGFCDCGAAYEWDAADCE